jgi:hypothetical protein
MRLFRYVVVAPAGAETVAPVEDVARVAGAAPGLVAGLVHTPASTSDPYLNDGAPPPVALELDFASIEALEAAVAPAGPLAALARMLPEGTTQQAMLARRFPVPDANGKAACTYLVAYEGRAADDVAWLEYYLAHHPAIMARFPGIRAIEICTRLDWMGGIGLRRATALQRNKVVFDDAAALTAALNSPVRHEMRADFTKFPPYEGPVTHFPMATRRMA